MIGKWAWVGIGVGAFFAFVIILYALYYGCVTTCISCCDYDSYVKTTTSSDKNNLLPDETIPTDKSHNKKEGDSKLNISEISRKPNRVDKTHPTDYKSNGGKDHRREREFDIYYVDERAPDWRGEHHAKIHVHNKPDQYGHMLPTNQKAGKESHIMRWLDNSTKIRATHEVGSACYGSHDRRFNMSKFYQSNTPCSAGTRSYELKWQENYNNKQYRPRDLFF